jgi:BirA family biotin operon repressor/biotin-[acetyl-CoA-carboxylase] ligase
LNEVMVPDLSIKWPNDILSGSYKICGILIENMTAGAEIQSSVVGIGLNVNQIDFGHLPQASSLQLLLGKPFGIDETRELLLRYLRTYFEVLEDGDRSGLRDSYEALMFRKGKASTFKGSDGHLFMGFIRGVSPEGRLIIAVEGEELREFDLKEVQLLY